MCLNPNLCPVSPVSMNAGKFGFVLIRCRGSRGVHVHGSGSDPSGGAADRPSSHRRASHRGRAHRRHHGRQRTRPLAYVHGECRAMSLLLADLQTRLRTVEELDETLTALTLGLPYCLRRSLAMTNPIQKSDRSRAACEAACETAGKPSAAIGGGRCPR